MHFAPGGLWSQGWPVCATCHLLGLYFSAQNVSRTETWTWCLQWYKFCSGEMTEKEHYFCSDTCVDVSWEELLKTMSWNDAKLMWEQNQTVCIMHVGSLTGGACWPFHTCLICVVRVSFLEFMRVHVHITDSAYCGFQGRCCPGLWPSKDGIYSLFQSSFIQSPCVFVSVVCSYQYYFVVNTTTRWEGCWARGWATGYSGTFNNPCYFWAFGAAQASLLQHLQLQLRTSPCAVPMPRLCHVGSSRAGLSQELSDTNPQVWQEASQHRLSSDTAEVPSHPAVCSATALSHKTQPLGSCFCLPLKNSSQSFLPCVSLCCSVIVLWLCFTKTLIGGLWGHEENVPWVSPIHSDKAAGLS